MINIFDLLKTYGQKTALNGFDLKVEKGEILGVLGPNGSGKSTLIKIIAGLINQYDGEIEINHNVPSIITKNRVSYLSDNNIFPDGNTVQETMEYYKYFYKDFDITLFLVILKKLNVEVDMKTKLKELSKGIRQLVRLALTMARNVDLYLLDEPLGGIDPIAKEIVIDTLVDSMKEESTMIIATHQVAEVERILTRVLFIKDGKSIGDYNCENIRFKENVSIEDKYKEVNSYA